MVCGVLMVEGIYIAKIVRCHTSSIKLCIHKIALLLSLSIYSRVVCRLLAPHDTLSCVLKLQSCRYRLCINNAVTVSDATHINKINYTNPNKFKNSWLKVKNFKRDNKDCWNVLLNKKELLVWWWNHNILFDPIS